MDCLRGGCQSNSRSRNGYNKFVSEEQEDERSSETLPNVIQLEPSKGERTKRKKCPSVQLDSVVKRFKGACRKVVQIAKRSGSSHFMQLFTNNQLLIHLSSSPQTSRKRKLYPTVGFTNTNNNNDSNDSQSSQDANNQLKIA